MNAKTLYNLFKPFELDFVTIKDVFDATGISKETFFKIQFESECSKSRDELCANSDCSHNLISLHNNEFYIKFIRDKEK